MIVLEELLAESMLTWCNLFRSSNLNANVERDVDARDGGEVDGDVDKDEADGDGDDGDDGDDDDDGQVYSECS